MALAVRDLTWSPEALTEALHIFAAHGDRENAILARVLQIRRLLLLGRVDEAAAACITAERVPAPARLRAVALLVAFEIALRRGRAGQARETLGRAREAAGRSGIGALCAEVEQAGRALVLPVARLVAGGVSRSLNLAEVEAMLDSPDLVVDGCRRWARRRDRVVRLSRRPVLFALLYGLAEAWPGEARRERLIERAFGVRRANESHRARLRVEVGRLRDELQPLAKIRASAHGFVLVARGAERVLLLAPPLERPDAVLALLADGEAWSTSALALAMGASQRTVQRALAALGEAGQVRTLGRGRSQRWLSAPVAGFSATLLLPDASRPR